MTRLYAVAGQHCTWFASVGPVRLIRGSFSKCHRKVRVTYKLHVFKLREEVDGDVKLVECAVEVEAG